MSERAEGEEYPDAGAPVPAATAAGEAEHPLILIKKKAAGGKDFETGEWIRLLREDPDFGDIIRAHEVAERKGDATKELASLVESTAKAIEGECKVSRKQSVKRADAAAAAMGDYSHTEGSLYRAVGTP